MKKILQGSILIFLTLTVNGCLKRDVYTTPQQPVNQSAITPIPSIEVPIKQEIPAQEIYSVDTPTTHDRIIPTTSIDTPPPLETYSTHEAITPPPATEGDYHQLKTVQGKLISVQERSNGLFFPQYSDKIILLQVFGQHCPYCLQEMPTLRRLQQQYAGNVQIIALQAQEPMDQSTASMLIQQYQMHYPVIDKEEATDLLFFLQQTFEWTGILPYTLIIKDGAVEYPFFGETSYQEIDEAIQSLL